MQIDTRADTSTERLAEVLDMQPGGFSFERAMLDASDDCIKIISVQGNLLTMNRAGCLALGVPQDSSFGMPWLPLLPNSIQAEGRKALSETLQGHSARFPGRSELGGDTKYWDNLLTPITDSQQRVRAILCVSRDVTTSTLLERMLERALAREQLLAQEMRHRIKNVFAVVSGLVGLAKREAGRSDTDAMQLLRERLWCLARASDVIFEPKQIGDAAQDQVEILAIVDVVLKPYAPKYLADGAPCGISRRFTTAIALILHELATNSVKYGSFNSAQGIVRINWTCDGVELLLTWSEHCNPAVHSAPYEPGFGSTMVDQLIWSVGGAINRRWGQDGLFVELRLPIS
ncbi:PAS domain-containing protein [Steroidobacter sp.]|uniref:PAS domain-containing protein n=1 Tax=Steroidobacter sp. TaxID=1978227 RepID=UPI001A4FA4AE|nr:PAS domain-containing protein [Steroidobacter sp.]MBL8269286.1 PAS domain-containing protein [Steroidobacter sp.]